MAWNPTYRINLLELVNRSYAQKAQRTNVRELMSNASFRQIFGNAVIDEIRRRTQQLNIDRFGQPFPAYSKAYIASLEFKVYNKSQGNVNLTLTREMMASLRPKGTNQELVIQIEGQNNRDKAQGHISGRYGRSSKIKKRDFLGLPRNEEERIFKSTVKDFSRDIPDIELEFVSQVGAQPGSTLALTALDLLN